MALDNLLRFLRSSTLAASIGVVGTGVAVLAAIGEAWRRSSIGLENAPALVALFVVGAATVVALWSVGMISQAYVQSILFRTIEHRVPGMIHTEAKPKSLMMTELENEVVRAAYAGFIEVANQAKGASDLSEARALELNALLLAINRLTKVALTSRHENEAMSASETRELLMVQELPEAQPHQTR